MGADDAGAGAGVRVHPATAVATDLPFTAAAKTVGRIGPFSKPIARPRRIMSSGMLDWAHGF
jgi:hypothetical protein